MMPIFQRLVLTLSVFLFTVETWGDVSCEKPEECPSSLAQLQSGGFVCTSFLVRNDLMATNLHCLPQDLRTTGASCKNRIHFSFPKSGAFNEEKLDCDSVQFVSQPLNQGSFNVDLAILKLKNPTTRETLRFSQDGFKSKQKITIYKFDPTKTGGLLRKTVCEAKPNSIYNPYFTSEYSPIVNLAPCESINGNSGSPLISEDGYVRGVLHSIANAPFLLSSDLAFADKSEMKVTFATNLSCVNLDLFSYPRRNYSACDVTVSPENQKKLEAALRQKALDEGLKSIDQKMKVIGDKYKSPELMLFDWQVSQKKPSPEEQKAAVIARFLFLPKCAALVTAPFGSIRNAVKGTQMNFELKVPYYRLISSVNADLIYSIDLKEEERKLKVMSPFQDWLSGKKVKLKMDLLSADGKNEAFEFEVPECPVKR